MANFTPADIRAYLTSSYTDEEITALCSDYFRNVYDTFAAGMTKGQKIQSLLDYCQRRGLIPNLVAALQRDRPEPFRNHFQQTVTEASKVAALQERDPRQVFVSHAHQDADFAHRLASDLRDRGWRVWIAPDSIRPGEKWGEAIGRALEECGVFVLVLTPASVRSRWVATEANLAIESEHKDILRFIPVKAENCQPPLLWTAYQDISFTEGYEKGLQDLLRELGQPDLSPAPPQKPTPPRPWPLPRWLTIVGAAVLLLAIIVTLTIWRNPCIVNPVRVSNKDGMALKCVRAGDFLMGSTDTDPDARDDEKPQRKVKLDTFWIDRTEVTNAMYAKCVRQGVCRAPREMRSATRSSYYNDPSYGDYPVIYVLWEDARKYCEWAGRRLPTEAEWEKAARGTDGRIYPWGNEPPDDQRANYGGKIGDTTPVDRYPAGASPYGALDLAGNVWEWTADWYGESYHLNAPMENPQGPDHGAKRVTRGSSYSVFYDHTHIRAAYRGNYDPADPHDNIGFRCALSPFWERN